MKWKCQYVFYDGTPRGLDSWVVDSTVNPSGGDYVCRLIDETELRVLDNTGGRWARPIIDFDRPLAREPGGISPINPTIETPNTMPSDVNIYSGPWFGNTTVEVQNPLTTGWDDAVEKLRHPDSAPVPSENKTSSLQGWMMEAKKSGLLWLVVLIAGYFAWRKLK